jgi:hypothetical protein
MNVRIPSIDRWMRGQKQKQYAKIALAFVLGMVLIVSIQSYQQAQLDDELFNSSYQLHIRLVQRSSAWEWEDSVKVTIRDSEDNLVEVITLRKPPNADAREGESSLYLTRWEWAEYPLTFTGPNFDEFTHNVDPYAFRENDPWVISSSIKIIYSDLNFVIHPDFIVHIGLGY